MTKGSDPFVIFKFETSVISVKRMLKPTNFKAEELYSP